MKFISQALVTLALYAQGSSAAPTTGPANVFEKRAESCSITETAPVADALLALLVQSSVHSALERYVFVVFTV
ncbi:hypothetical protein B0H13DRAFT_2124949, partial [Mycena leptocephala]